MPSRAVALRTLEPLSLPRRRAASPARQNVALLRQGETLLRSLDDRTLSRGTPLAPGGTIGKHLRHCLEFHACLLDGLRTGRVDYEGRQRRTDLETGVRRARAALHEAASGLARISEEDVYRFLRVRGEGCAAGSGWADSTLQRELQFLFSHTMHHFALIAVLARAFGLDPGSTLGVAPSTLATWGARPPAPPAPPLWK
jgi:uncharacterized damage-inducible protein DinB